MVFPADPQGDRDDALSPYEVTVRELERVILERRLDRLNPRDRWLAAEALGATELGGQRPDTLDDHEPDDVDELREQAVTKLRHPSVARLWRHQPRPPTGA